MVLIIDYGSQFTALIRKKICEIAPDEQIMLDPIPEQPEEYRLSPDVHAIILSGGPKSVNDPSSPRIPNGILESRYPVLGICYGMQLLAKALGGKVQTDPSKSGEFGKAQLQILDDSMLFQGIPSKSVPVWMSHRDTVEQLPEGFIATARTDDTSFATMESRERKIFGVQFHLEVAHTPDGGAILRNFLRVSKP